MKRQAKCRFGMTATTWGARKCSTLAPMRRMRPTGSPLYELAPERICDTCAKWLGAHGYTTEIVK